MPDLDNEEQLKKIIRDSCTPVEPAPEYERRLHQMIVSESRTARPARGLWKSPLLWASVAAVVVLLALGLVLRGQPDGSPLVLPGASPSPSAAVTPAASAGPTAIPTTEPASSPETTPSSEPTAEPSPEPSEPPVLAGTGTLEIWVTDVPPAQEVTSIIVELSNIRVWREADDPEAEGEWITAIEGPVTFDLILLKEEGTEEILGALEIDTGHYTQIRMDVALLEAVIDDVTVTEGIKFPSEVIKTAGEFYIEEGKTTELLFDFDADKSLKLTGEGKVLFSPVVKLIVTGPY